MEMKEEDNSIMEREGGREGEGAGRGGPRRVSAHVRLRAEVPNEKLRNCRRH